MKHFFVAGLMIEGNNRNSIVNLISEGVNRIVNDDHIFHVSICDNPQIFHVIPFRSLDAVLPVHAILEKFVFGIDIVENSISISLVRSCEHHYLK